MKESSTLKKDLKSMDILYKAMLSGTIMAGAILYYVSKDGKNENNFNTIFYIILTSALVIIFLGNLFFFI